VAVDIDELIGVLTYAIEHETCEIVTIDAHIQGRGVGSALLNAVKALDGGGVHPSHTIDHKRQSQSTVIL